MRRYAGALVSTGVGYIGAGVVGLIARDYIEPGDLIMTGVLAFVLGAVIEWRQP